MARVFPGPVVSVNRGPLLSDIDLQARVVHPQGTGTEVLEEGFLVAPSDVLTVTATLYNMTQSTTVGAVSVNANNFSATLINDNEWTEDLIGRNFLINVPASNFTAYGKYRLIIDLTLTGGGRRRWGHDYNVEQIEP